MTRATVSVNRNIPAGTEVTFTSAVEFDIVDGKPANIAVTIIDKKGIWSGKSTNQKLDNITEE